MSENTQLENISLANLGGGAAVEMFENSFKQVLENINDPNTNFKTARKLTLEVELKPLSENRDSANYSITCKTKLAPQKPFSKVLYIGPTEEGYVARERDPKQTDMFADTNIKNLNAQSNTPN